MKALEENVAEVGAGVKAKCAETIDSLRRPWKEGKGKLEESQAKAEDGWQDFQRVAYSVQCITGFFASP